MTNDEMRALSDQLRAFYATYDAATANFFITVIQEAFQIKNRRNVVLWLTTAGTRRNFISRNLSPGELNMRVAFLEALLNDTPPNSPQKSIEFTLWPTRVGQKLREYLSLKYTRRAVSSIGFLSKKVIFTYDIYAEPEEDLEDEESDEYDDLFDE